jgi:hypothetical protein
MSLTSVIRPYSKGLSAVTASYYGDASVDDLLAGRHGQL